jgi:hypothetical protein
MPSKRPRQLSPVPSWSHPKCDCGKVLSLDLEDAKKWWRIYADHNGNHNPVRYYQCRYGTYHWTTDLEGRAAS